MDLLTEDSDLELDDTNWKIYTEDVNALPQYISTSAVVQNCFSTQGCIIEGSVKNSVLGTNCVVAKDAKVVDTVLMPGAKVAEGASVIRCIVAEDVEIGPGVTVGSKNSEPIELVANNLYKEGD